MQFVQAPTKRPGTDEGCDECHVQWAQADLQCDQRRKSKEDAQSEGGAVGGTFDDVLQAVDQGSADDLIEALIQHGTLSPEARNAP